MKSLWHHGKGPVFVPFFDRDPHPDCPLWVVRIPVRHEVTDFTSLVFVSPTGKRPTEGVYEFQELCRQSHVRVVHRVRWEKSNTYKTFQELPKKKECLTGYLICTVNRNQISECLSSFNQTLIFFCTTSDHFVYCI